eukprot:403347891
MPLQQQMPQYAPMPVYTRQSLDLVRNKLDAYVQSLPGDKKIEHKYVMKVKGKCLNNFLGIIKTDLARLSVEGFPQELNKQIPALMLLKKYDLIWFDIQIEQRVATLKANFFVGYNLGYNTYKMGLFCLIGIAHLPDSMNKLRFYRTFDIRPSLSTNIGQFVEEEMSSVPKHAGLVVMNLFQAIKMISSKIINKLPVCGNVEYEEDKLNDPMNQLLLQNQQSSQALKYSNSQILQQQQQNDYNTAGGPGGINETTVFLDDDGEYDEIDANDLSI